MICDNLEINEQGHLTINGHDTVKLAKEYGTPLYVMDEDKIREKCRRYVVAMKEKLGDNFRVLYASKAASFKALYEIVSSEGMGCDVVSSGEIYTAIKAGFDLSKAYFHSNNKTDFDIEYAIGNKIGYFVVDFKEELTVINEEAKRQGLVQKVLLRITPGIDPHTYEAVSTGKVDSKFGSAIETGQAREMTKYALSLSNIELTGFHCHIGSQVFDSDNYIAGSEIMLNFIKSMKDEFGFTAKQLDIGGGFGVRYTEDDPELDIETGVKLVCDKIKEVCAELEIDIPMILMEPGRSIVGDSGVTLYTAGSLKVIPGYKNYVSIDGGMADNPRFALYGSAYTVCNASKMNEDKTLVADVVGRCCESGDIIQKSVALPETERGDIIAVLTTGAYNYSMSSNYNRLQKPAVVMVTKDSARVVVKRETLEYLTENDI